MRNRFDLGSDCYAGYGLPQFGDASAYPSIKQGRFRLRATVMEYQKALLFKDGSHVKTLGAGKYRFWGRNYVLNVFDMRPANIVMPSQEILTNDLVAVRISMRLRYAVIDPLKAYRASASYVEDIYTFAHDAIRQLINTKSIFEVMEHKSEYGVMVLDSIKGRIAEVGCELLEVAIRDFGLPGEFKKAFTQVLVAQEEGKAALEKARGETAALRNLANAAQLLESRPELSLLRAIQAVEKSGGTVILGGQGEFVSAKPKPQKSKTE